jgi:hypothetical protein
MIGKYSIASLLALWLFLIIGLMTILQHYNLEIFFTLWLLGIIVAVELGIDGYARPRHLTYIRYVIAAGIVLFGYTTAVKVLEVLAG